MSETMEKYNHIVRTHWIAPPEEADSLDWWMEASRFVIEIIEQNRDEFTVGMLTRPSISVWSRTITFGAYNLDELRRYMRMVPQPKQWNKDSDGQPKLVATVNGWNIEMVRYDLTCDVVETGEYQEVEVDEVVTPAVRQTVTKQVPVTVTECPSMLAE